MRDRTLRPGRGRRGGLPRQARESDTNPRGCAPGGGERLSIRSETEPHDKVEVFLEQHRHSGIRDGAQRTAGHIECLELCRRALRVDAVQRAAIERWPMSLLSPASHGARKGPGQRFASRPGMSNEMLLLRSVQIDASGHDVLAVDNSILGHLRALGYRFLRLRCFRRLVLLVRHSVLAIS